ncbi:hypothetical protein [Krasilnikovia sp. M28-CT-15]|uniref:hypothetical protein n=1 Tax=Krasilnikovia sp. M28-CT-15 TaxID=3373540 RepID=UPI0038777A3C
MIPHVDPPRLPRRPSGSNWLPAHRGSGPAVAVQPPPRMACAPAAPADRDHPPRHHARRLPTQLTRDPQRQRLEFVTADPDHAQTYLSAAYATAVTIRAARDTYRFRHLRLGPGPFLVDTLDDQAPAEYRSGPAAAILVGRVHRGWCMDLALDDRYGPGDLVLHADLDRAYHGWHESLRASIVALPPQAVAEAARNHPDGPPPRLRFTATRPAHPADARRWLSVVDHVSDSLHTAPEFITNPLMVGPTTRLLAAALLTTFPNTCVPGPHHYDRTDATPAALTRAVAFMEANADLDITAVDIARAARVTIRAVHRAFRRHLDTTPTAYLRRVRRDRADERSTWDSQPDDSPAP